MPRLSLGLGISSSSKLLSVPSGIPVASTPSIDISGLGGANGTYSRMGTGTNPMEEWTLTGYAYRNPSTNGYEPKVFLFAPNSIISDGNTNQLGTPYSQWTLLSMYHDSEYNSWITDVIASSPSTNPSTIPTVGWTPPITITTTPATPAAPAAPGIDTNYVQDIFLTNSIREGMNGVWTNVSSDLGFPAWVNYLFNSYVYLLAPNNGYSGGESWFFYNSDDGGPAGISNPSTNPGSLPTTGWTQNISISAHTWKIADNNYLVRGLTYDDGGPSYYSYPANGVSVKRTPLQGATLYGDNGTFIFYTAANGGTFTLLQQIAYEESSFISTLATKTGSPSARGIPAYGYTIGNPAQQYVTGSLIIEPVRFVPLSAQNILISGIIFNDNPTISEYFYDGQPLTQNSTPPFYYWSTAGDDHAFLLFNNTNNPKRWEMGVYSGNSSNNFAYNYASSVSGIPLSGWVITQDQISDVTGYPGITQA